MNPASALGISLNADQSRAEGEIMPSIRARQTHLLTGHAGSGKTTLVQVLAANMRAEGLSIALTAPTHKAVSVLAKKLRAAEIEIPCQTIQSLLSLRPKPQGDRLRFERDKRARPVMADVVIIDECSMIDASLLGHIKRHLPNSAILFVGDPAQLPPVGEDHSGTFDTRKHSHLSTIVRQEACNPILAAADALRRQQGEAIDWSWACKSMAKPLGVYLPGDGADAWMHKAFTSPEFAADTDAYRYVCWTNERVAQVNAKVRRWLYGENIPTPFSVGEHILARAPVVIDDEQIIANNEEATVRSIESSWTDVRLEGWRTSIPTWGISARNDDGADIGLDVVRDDGAYKDALNELLESARQDSSWWPTFHAFKQRFAVLQSVYAQTVHSSQGSTYRNVFVDMPEMRRWVRADLLEAQRAMYVAATRPTHALVLVGA